MNHIKWRTLNCRCPKGLFGLDPPAGISRDVTFSRWWFPVRTPCADTHVNVFRWDVYLYHTSCSAVSLSKCFKLKSASFRSPEEARGERDGDGDGGVGADRAVLLRVLAAIENRPHLSPPAPPPASFLRPPPPLDGVAILWSLLRQRWNRPACLKCTQMPFDLSSRVWEAQLGTAAPFFTPFTRNPAWKGEKNI